MSSHINDNNHIKIGYDNFASALIACYKHNSKLDNLGKRKMIPYKCKICNKIHTGRDSKKIITFNVRAKAIIKINECVNKSILIKQIEL
jgi:hypothetical protein